MIGTTLSDFLLFAQRFAGWTFADQLWMAIVEGQRQVN